METASIPSSNFQNAQNYIFYYSINKDCDMKSMMNNILTYKLI